LSSLSLNDDEAQLLINENWLMKKTQDGPEFFIDLGHRQLRMGPVIKRQPLPIHFRSQAQRFDSEYDDIAFQIGWGSRKSFGAGQKSKAMDTFKIERFDINFVKELTEILKDWAINVNPEDVVAQRINRRKKVRCYLLKADLIDYAYLRRIEDLEKISLEERCDGTEFISPQENVEYLRKAIEVSKRP